MITTKSIGLDAETANPKPVRQFNWVGQPMKEGESYWGEAGEPPQPQPEPEPDPQPRPRKVRRPRKAWSSEARAAYSERMKAWWQAKKEQSTSTGGT